MKQLDIITKKYDQTLLILIVLLCIVGTVMLYSSSSSISLEETRGGTDTLFLQSHLKRLLVGIMFLFFFMLMDYRQLKKVAPGLLIGSLLLLLSTKLIYMAKGFTFPARWLDVGFISFQTSDLVRLSMIIYLAYYIDKKRTVIKDFYKGFIPPLILIIIVSFLIIIQPDFSTAAVIALVCFVMLFLGGAKISHLLTTGTVALTVLIPVMLMRSYRLKRVLYWLESIINNNSTHNQEEVGYQIQQSLISLGNGGFMGLGLGNSMEKNLFLPTPHTDFIFAIIGEELGLVGVIFILTLFLLVFQRCIKIAKNTTDPFGVMLSVGLAFSFIIYAFINIAVVTNLVPTTGLPMPLISYGGSSLVINLASLGILLNISQSKRSVKHQTGWKPKLYA